MIGAFVAACSLASPAVVGAATKSASDIAPIVGKWSSAGAVIDVTGGGGSYQGTVVSGHFTNNCPNLNGPGTVEWKMSGAGLSYSGTVPWVNLNDCSPIGDGPTTWTLTSVNSGTLHSTSPDGTRSDSASLTRIGTWPGADNGGNGGGNKPKTNCKKNGHRVLCPKQKKVVKKAVRTIRKTRAAAKPKAYKKASPQGKSARLQQLVDVSARAQGLLDDWRKFKLATKNAAAKVYNDPFLNKLQGSAEKSRDAILDNIHKAQDGIAEFNYKLSKLGDKVYDASDGYGPDLTSVFSVILDETAGKLYEGICGPENLNVAGVTCWKLLNPPQKANTYSQTYQLLLDTENTNGPPTTGGRTVSVDPQTGEIVFQLYAGTNYGYTGSSG